VLSVEQAKVCLTAWCGNPSQPTPARSATHCRAGSFKQFNDDPFHSAASAENGAARSPAGGSVELSAAGPGSSARPAVASLFQTATYTDSVGVDSGRRGVFKKKSSARIVLPEDIPAGDVPAREQRRSHQAGAVAGGRRCQR
jgi:hypothetical protein